MLDRAFRLFPLTGLTVAACFAQAVPHVIQYSGTLKGTLPVLDGTTVNVTFSVYSEKQGGAPLWQEIQSVKIDGGGRYSVELGSTQEHGIPSEVFFSSTGPRWLGVKAGADEEERALIVSVPYALRAEEATRLAGVDSNEFVRKSDLARAVQEKTATLNAKSPMGPEATMGQTKFSATTTTNVVVVQQLGTGKGLVAVAAGTAVAATATGASGLAVSGTATSTTGSGIGIQGTTSSPTGAGVAGFNNATSGSGTGVSGTANSPAGSGVFAVNYATTSFAFGLSAESFSATGAGAGGQDNVPGGIGVEGYNGATTGSGAGVTGYSGSSSGTGVSGYAGSTGGGTGVSGGTASPTGFAMSAYNSANTGSSVGLQVGTASPQGTALVANAPSGALAGQFNGNVNVSGNLSVSGTVSKGGGSFRIDHPLDPEHKYLSHSFVESPDMMNIYNGVVTLSRRGDALVTLPEWFESLNRDFRYQLTCIGGFSPVFIAGEITHNEFRISGGRKGMRVSWQVTGIRKDEFANEHRIRVEEDKPAF